MQSIVCVYNTETRKKESFVPQDKSCVLMYTCGPTVYNYAHIGNFRTYVFEDIFRRTLQFFGFGVKQAMNITDVDDKTIRGAIETKKSLKDFTSTYKSAFFEDIQTLNIERAEYYPAATDYIPQMIEFIQQLLCKGVAYVSKDKSIYYSIYKCSNYGRLSHLPIDSLKVGSGERLVDNDEYEKEHVGDFVLWKSYDAARDGNIFWDSPFGPGRPGWHLECSTMSMSLLGDTLDVHLGAVDNIFPHHENEIAQSESLSGKQFVKYWLHSEHLIVDHKKMSKSLGNFYTLRDLLNRGYSGKEVRYMLLQTHYRTQLNFTFQGMEAAKNSLCHINDFIQRIQEKSNSGIKPSSCCDELLSKAFNQFSEALADDLNISVALGALFDMMHSINTLSDTGVMNGGDFNEVVMMMQKFDKVLGVCTFASQESIPEDLLDTLKQREKARSERNWGLADQLRKNIYDRGYVIEDTDSGSRLKRK